MFYLRQATSQSVLLGPYVDSGGGALTGLTLNQSCFMLSWNGGAFAAKQETTTASHRGLGWYSVMLSGATDVNCVGRLTIVSSGANALQVWHERTVLTAAQYDYTVSGNVSNIWGVDMSTVTPVAARSPLNAMRALRNRVTSSGSTLTTYQEDDSTPAWTSVLTVGNSAQLIVESNPD